MLSTKSLLRRLLRWFTSESSARCVDPQPIRLKRAYNPAVHSLEARLVLNATAELNALGQLVISSDAVGAIDETVSLDVQPSGDLIVQDAGGVVPITNHPGNATSPLDFASITSGQILIDLGGGDDTVNLEVPDGLDVSIVDGAGEDRVNLIYQSPNVLPSSDSVIIETETITINDGSPAVSLSNDNLQLSGRILLGTTTDATDIDLGTGSLDVDGVAELRGSVSFFGSGGGADFSDATLTASQAGASLGFRLLDPVDSDLTLGTVDSSGGQAIENISVIAASSLRTTQSIEIAGNLGVQGVSDTVQIDSPLSADAIQIRSGGDIAVEGTLSATSGPLFLDSSSFIRAAADLNTALAGSNGAMTLIASSIELTGANLRADGANITLIGPSIVDGSVSIDSNSDGLTADAGDIVFAGRVSGADSLNDNLNVRAVGAAGGNVVFQSTIGTTPTAAAVFDLTSLTVEADRIDIGDVGISNGALNLTAPDIRLTGTIWRTLGAGEITIDGQITLPIGDFQIDSSDSVTFLGNLVGQLGSQDVAISSTNDVQFSGQLNGFTDLVINAGGIASFAQSVALGGEMDVAASGIDVLAASLTTSGDMIFRDVVAFRVDTTLSANEIRFDDAVSVDVATTVQAASPIVNPIAATALVKNGDGKLLLTADNSYTIATQVNAGTLTVEGSIADSAADVTVASGATLEGSGIVGADVVVQSGGTISPGVFGGDQESGLQTNSLTLLPGSIVQIQLSGLIAGQDYDQLILDGSNVSDSVASLDGAVLDLSLNANPPPGTEFVIVVNDGVDPIDGRFRVNFDTNGNPLATPRILEEGDPVLVPFGSASTSAHITYFGGDGNDVTIVTSGNVVLPGSGVTIISRLGTDIHVRTGSSFATAQSSTPTIRPIAGLNNNTLVINGVASDDTVFLDMDGFVVQDPGAVNFNGNILIEAGESNADSDRFIIFDSNLATDDTPDGLTYAFSSLEGGLVRFDSIGDAADFQVTLSDVEAVVQSIESPIANVDFRSSDETIRISADPLAIDRTLFEVETAAGTGTQLSIRNPTDALLLGGTDGDDSFIVDDLGTSNGRLQSQVTIDGQAGSDSIVINTNLSLGSGSTTGDLNLVGESVSINADVNTTGGDSDGSLNVRASDAIRVGSGATVNVGDSVVDFGAAGGLIDTSNGNLVSSATGDAIFLHDASTVTLGDVTVLNGTLQIGADQNVAGLVSQNPLASIQVDRFSASTFNAIDLSNANNQLRLVEEVLSEGAIQITDDTGDLTLSRIDSTGNDVTAITQGSVLLTNDAVTARNATVRIVADNAIAEIDIDDSQPNITAARIDLIADGQGIGQLSANNIDVVASEEFNATTGGFNGDISIGSQQAGLPIGLIDAGTGNVNLDVVSVDDSSINIDSDIIANQLQITASQGIGNGRELELLSVRELTAETNAGGINLDWTATNRTTLHLASTQTGDIRINQVGAQRMDIESIQNSTGSVRITNSDQSIDVIGPQNSVNAISVGGNGVVELAARGVDSDVFLRNTLESENGEVRLFADRNVVLGSGGDILSATGAVVIRGDDRSGEFGGVVSMSDGALIDAGDDTIEITASGTIDLGGLRTRSTSLTAVQVFSEVGAITDRGDQHIDVDANFGTTNLRSSLGVGVDDAIDTSIGRLNSQVSTVGATQISEADAIELTSVITNDGHININAGGSITAVLVESTNVAGSDDVRGAGGSESRDINLRATGSQSDILIDQISALRESDVTLIADDDVLDRNAMDELRITADALAVTSNNQTNDQIQAIDLSVNVNDIEAQSLGVNRGDIEIREVDSINLATSDRTDDGEQLVTENGEIRVFAGESIEVGDPSTSNETNTLLADPELVAGGENGRIRLESGQTLQLGDAVQLQAAQSTIDAVVLQSTDIILGRDIEINTGDSVGVARIFAPRPDVELMETAFYDSTTVSTNVLEQAAINDAEGKLTLDIGSEGERGLTINIDWGAETERFQQIDGLSGDAPPLTVSHVYLEADILESRLNGRESETKPLNVKFSVRHHESIRVLGSTVTQDGSDIENVPGLVVSSTDNPLTAQSEQVQILENGTANFIIPSLSIPVAFFPVRDVIPVLDEPEVFVKTEQSVELTSGTLETVSTSVSSSVGRDEYFQIRVLSPDPNGEDLAPPERLPDDILDGDKLRELFSRLPDGRYEIEYVLGDGNERSILRVDLRDGKSIVPSDELDGGPLRLRLIDGEAESASEAIDDSNDERDELIDSQTQRRQVNQNLPLQQDVKNEDRSASRSGTSNEETIPVSAGVLIGAGFTRKHARTPGRFSIAKRFLARKDRNQSA